jgi:membrane protease YdiL (CAAX protease family)
MLVEQPKEQGVPWGPREVWLGVGTLVLWLGLSALILIGGNYYGMNIGLLLGIAELLLLVPAWWFTVRKYGVGWGALGLRGFTGGALGLGCMLMVVSYGFNMFYSLFLSFFGLSIQMDLVPLFAGLDSPWFLLAGGILLAPFAEEVFFRGFVFAGLRQRYGWKKAGVISALLFSLVHLQLTAILPIFIIGYIFAYLYEKGGSIWPAIVMHVSTNALALCAAYALSHTDLF